MISIIGNNVVIFIGVVATIEPIEIYSTLLIWRGQIPSKHCNDKTSMEYYSLRVLRLAKCDNKHNVKNSRSGWHVHIYFMRLIFRLTHSNENTHQTIQSHCDATLTTQQCLLLICFKCGQIIARKKEEIMKIENEAGNDDAEHRLIQFYRWLFCGFDYELSQELTWFGSIRLSGHLWGIKWRTHQNGQHR